MTSIFQGKRALLLEDEVLVAMMVADMLEEMGFAAVEQLRTLASAMTSAKDHPPHIAILDLHVTDGITLPVAELLALRGIRSVFVTGDPGALSVRGIAKELVLMKPFAPADLQTALHYAFDNPVIA